MREQGKPYSGPLETGLAVQIPRAVVREAALRLQEAGVPEPGASAEILMSELVGRTRGELALLSEPLSEGDAALYESWVLRREMREPVQRILGYAYFRNLKLKLSSETLVPRADTESVVDAALEAVDRRAVRLVLDLGTGSGAIAISIADERPGCEVHGADISEGALRISRENAARAGRCIRFHQADLTAGLRGLESRVEVLVSNPPYVPPATLESLEPEVRDWDPRGALDGGVDGLDFYRRIFEDCPPLLAPGADLVLEVGDGQADAVLELGGAAGYEPLGTRRDLAGNVRVALLRRV